MFIKRHRFKYMYLKYIDINRRLCDKDIKINNVLNFC